MQKTQLQKIKMKIKQNFGIIKVCKNCFSFITFFHSAFLVCVQIINSNQNSNSDRIDQMKNTMKMFLSSFLSPILVSKESFCKTCPHRRSCCTFTHTPAQSALH